MRVTITPLQVGIPVHLSPLAQPWFSPAFWGSCFSGVFGHSLLSLPDGSSGVGLSRKSYVESSLISEVWILMLLCHSMSVRYLEPWTIEGMLNYSLKYKFYLTIEMEQNPFKIYSVEVSPSFPAFCSPPKLLWILLPHLLFCLVTWWLSPGLPTGAWMGHYLQQCLYLTSAYTTGKDLFFSPQQPLIAQKY